MCDSNNWNKPECTSRHAKKGSTAWVNTSRVVGASDGGTLRYREVTGTTRASYFTYRLGTFAHPGDFYVFELDYPDDKERIIEVQVSTTHPQVWSNVQSGVGAETGGKFFNTQKMQTLSWIHVADSGVHSLTVMNVRPHWPAAVSALRVYHVVGDLVAVPSSGERSFGIHTERDYVRSGIGCAPPVCTRPPYTILPTAANCYSPSNFGPTCLTVNQD